MLSEITLQKITIIKEMIMKFFSQSTPMLFKHLRTQFFFEKRMKNQVTKSNVAL